MIGSWKNSKYLFVNKSPETLEISSFARNSKSLAAMIFIYASLGNLRTLFAVSNGLIQIIQIAFINFGYIKMRLVRRRQL